MNHYPPHIEIIKDASQKPDFHSSQPWFRSRRVLLFLVVFLVSASGGLAYNFSRPPIYRSNATLLTSAMNAIDQVKSETDIQHVAIQKHILLGQDLLEASLQKLNSIYPQHQLSLLDVRRMLQVKTLQETNLVEMSAEGNDADVLPLLINSWIDVYLEARAAEVENQKGDTTDRLKTELTGLEQKIAVARKALDEFRKKNDISSTDRNENTALARLSGLTAALNKASEEEIKAKARLTAVKAAIQRGDAVVPQQEQPGLDQLERRLQQLQEKLTQLDKQYTRDYMALHPSMKSIPLEIEKLKQAIENKQQFGKNIVVTETEQSYAAATQAVIEIRNQLNEHKHLAAAFTDRFTKHQSLQHDLEGLEKLYRDMQERLVQIETKQVEKYPQVHVVERAFLNKDPISPKYQRDALIIVMASLLLALLSVWILDYLTHHPKTETAPGLTLSGIHLYKDFGNQAPMLSQNDRGQLAQSQNLALAAPLQREISDFELKALMNSANATGKQLMYLLLNGVNLDEAYSLTYPESGFIKLEGAVPRNISVNSLLETTGTETFPAWNPDKMTSVEDFARVITLAAIDSGVAHPEEINADAIRHTYIVYLVRQGLRLTSLEQLVGYISNETLLSYASYSPPRAGCGVEEINRVHPVLV